MNRRTPRLTSIRRHAVDRLLVQYLEMPEAEQAGFLADCRQRYPRLYRWFAQLVDGGHTITLLDDSIRQLADDAVQSRSEGEKPTQLPPGTEIGPWRIVEEIGHGGMGMVYRGERADGTFEMDVAVKLIGRRKRGLAELLQRECRLLARLDHPAVTRLVDAGLDDRAGPFLVMEWVDGTDLDEWIEAENPSLEQRLELYGQLVEATAHAHQRLIVHGDIKPGNVRVRSDGSVKLMDFGVARLLEDDDRENHGLRAMTPSFAAPEQFDGENITPRSDTWSLGALLYWLLTGTSLPRDTKQVEQGLLATGLGRRIELGCIIQNACSDSVADRYQSAAELAMELERFRNHLPMAAMPANSRYRLAKFARRNPVLLGGITATLSALILGMLATVLMYQQAIEERDRAERHAAELTQVATFQEAQLADIDVAVMGANMQAVLAGMARESLGTQVISVPEADQLSLFDDTLSQINFTDYALRTLEENVFERTRKAIDEMFAEQPLVKARLFQAQATTLREVGLLDRAMEPQHRALHIRQSLLGPEHPDTWHSMMQLTHMQVVLGQYTDALRTLEDLLALQLPAVGELHADTLATLNSIGSIHFYLGELDSTKAYYRRALEGRLEVLGEHHGDTAFTMTGLGAALRVTGQLEDAEHYLSRALAILEDVHGEQHHRTRNTMRQLASTLVEQGRLEDAERQLLRTLAIEQQALGKQHPEGTHTLYHLGRVQQLQGRYDEAEDSLREAMEGRRKMLGQEHPQTLAATHRLADLLRDTGNVAEAERLSALAAGPEYGERYR